jgi:peptide/nickel transport system ATP-binding protein
LLLDPKVIVADEPVSMVDASLRATILESLFRIHQERGISLVYITHDLTTAYQLSHTILIMYRGDVVEVGDVDQVIKAPRHPYTQMLVRSIPLADTNRRWGEDASTASTTPQEAPPASATEPISNDGGCPFADLCPHAMPRCGQSNPPLVLTDPGRGTACHLYDDAAPLSQQQLGALSHGGA